MSTPMPQADQDESDILDRERFLAFRPFAIRLGFLVAFMPLLSLVPHYFLNPELVRETVWLRVLGTLAWGLYPFTLLTGVPRRLLPGFLYGPAIVVLGLVLMQHSRSVSGGSEYAGLLSVFYLVPPLLGMPFSRKENVLGILLLLFLPNIAAILLPRLEIPLYQLDAAAIPVSVITLYLQNLFDRQFEEKHNYQRQLSELAHRDALTGTFNRRYFMEIGGRMLKQAHRTKEPISLIILDIDHLKNVNDKFGHAAGDQAIQETVRLMLKSLRETDLVARIGGEEFVAILPGTDQAAGQVASERLRAAIEGTAILIEGGATSIRFTASLGLAEAMKNEESLDNLLGRADQALYEAKRGGRNQVKLAIAGPFTGSPSGDV